jgi:hypothetical protein
MVLVLTPSVRLLWCGIVSAAVTAWMSRSRPRVDVGQVHAARVGDPLCEPGAVARAGNQQGGEGAGQSGQGGHLRAGVFETGERLLLAGREAVRLGQQDAGCPAGG